jgi:hypothetical protein
MEFKFVGLSFYHTVNLPGGPFTVQSSIANSEPDTIYITNITGPNGPLADDDPTLLEIEQAFNDQLSDLDFDGSIYTEALKQPPSSD